MCRLYFRGCVYLPKVGVDCLAQLRASLKALELVLPIVLCIQEGRPGDELESAVAKAKDNQSITLPPALDEVMLSSDMATATAAGEHDKVFAMLRSSYEPERLLPKRGLFRFLDSALDKPRFQATSMLKALVELVRPQSNRDALLCYFRLLGDADLKIEDAAWASEVEDLRLLVVARSDTQTDTSAFVKAKAAFETEKGRRLYKAVTVFATGAYPWHKYIRHGSLWFSPKSVI
jgi:hypothetical protein